MIDRKPIGSFPLLLLVVLGGPVTTLGAQMQHTTKADTMSKRSPMPMRPLDLPMNRDGSGTAWQPDSSPMYALHRMTRSGEFMLHGNLVLQYIKERGVRGDGQFGSINWLMGMARRQLAAGDLSVRAMLSAEPFTVGECGYPALLATGESCEGGQRLHDRQHPHDLFMELAASYEREITRGLGLQIYGGPVGEPALGPVAYPHRMSAQPNPIAPIGHHWFDATHISFGVATAGLFGKVWKLEGSLFNGREPDENRYDLDLGRLDSYSGRLWLLPNARWALQASAGRLNEVEPARGAEPPKDQTRLTASASYHQPLMKGGIWASTLLWGRNKTAGRATDAFLVETNLNLAEVNVFFFRAETVRKTGEDLVLDQPRQGPADPTLVDDVFTVASLSAGHVHQFGPFGGLVPALGVRVGVSFVPAELKPFYGARVQPGFAIFASLRPGRAQMGGMSGMPPSMPMPAGVR